MRTLLSVHVQVDGKWPTDKELENRNSVISELSEGNLGNFKGAGAGMGTMDFAYEVHDEKAARREIAKVLFKHLPGYEQTVYGSEVKASRKAKVANQNVKQSDQPKLDFGMGM